MAEPESTNEVAVLKGRLERLTRRWDDQAERIRGAQELLVARVPVLVATAGLFLAVSMGWYADGSLDDESFESASGWDIFGLLVGATDDDHAGVFVFAGYYSWVVVLVALAAGALAMMISKRWVAVILAILLWLLTAGHLLLHSQISEQSDGEQLAGTWAAIVLMAACAVAWGNLAHKLRGLADDST